MVHGKITVCRDNECWNSALAGYQDAQLVKHVLAKGSAAPAKEA
jgi:hypothetical protein